MIYLKFKKTLNFKPCFFETLENKVDVKISRKRERKKSVLFYSVECFTFLQCCPIIFQTLGGGG